MANQRLEQILRDDHVAYAQGSPLLLEASALHRDKTTGDSIIQLKWKNIDSRIVKAVMIDLITYDAFQQQFKPIQYQYNDIEVRQNDDFGGRTPIIIRNDKIVRFDVVLKAVSFDDNTIWRSDVDHIFEPLPDPKPQLLKGELREQLARDLHAQNNYRADSYAMQTAYDLWQCGCGSWQKIGTPCLNCHISADTLAAISDHSTLSHNLTEYKAEQERQRIQAEKALEIARKEAEEKAKAEQIAREKAEAERKQREAEERRQAAIRKKRRLAICCVVLALAAVGVYYVKFHYIPQKQYENAVVLMENGQYEDAYNAFVALGDYSDAKEQIRNIGDHCYTTKQYGLAKTAYKRISSYVDVDIEIEKCEAALDAKWKVGKYVEFGTCSQTASGTDNTPIEWLVLARDGDNALFISRYVLDAQPYNEEFDYITWRECTLRTWLNTDFYNNAFSADDKQHIIKSYVTADRNPDYSTDPGYNTGDNVFLLSIDEVNKYFAGDTERICYLTDYAKKQMGYKGYECRWWLRSPGSCSLDAANVSYDGSVDYDGSSVDNKGAFRQSSYYGVRPAVWVRVF